MTESHIHRALHPLELQINSESHSWPVFHWEGEGSPLFFLHGFSGGGKDAEALAYHLGQGGDVYAVDLPGHQGTEVLPGGIDAWVHELNQVVCKLQCPGLHLCGYSMGGRLAMRMALAAPQLFAQLTLVSTTPGIVGDRASRKAWDLSMAEKARAMPSNDFASLWEELPILAGVQEGPEPWGSRLAERRRFHEGPGLAQVMETVGSGSVEPVWDVLPELTVPTLLLAGERDKKYVDIMTRMDEVLPQSTLEVVGNTGHCIHVESPSRLATALQRRDPRSPAHSLEESLLTF